jgi:DnaJ like chaperone protein
MARVFGKLIGAMLGLAAAGPLGVVLGQRSALNNGVIILGAKMAKADGQVTRAKIDAFKRAFHIRPEDEGRVGRLFDNARRSVEGFEPYAFTLAQTFVNQPAMLEDILSGLFQIAAADSNAISPIEADFLRSVAFTFNFGPEDFARIAARTGVRMPTAEQTREARREVKRDNAGDPFLVLGVTGTASNDAVKTAYRNLIRKHHPDKLVAAGLHPDQIAVANEKMKRINAAYDTICRMRGIK